MFIIIMVILLWTCVSILWNVYYNTTSFQKTYWEINSYYSAYYGAVSSIERWLLMTRLKYPWYNWSWWFKWNNLIWSNVNLFSGEDSFGKLSMDWNSMYWTVNSATDHIIWKLNNEKLVYIWFRNYDDINGNQNNFNAEWWENEYNNWILNNDSFSISGTITPTTWRIGSKLEFWNFDWLIDFWAECVEWQFPSCTERLWYTIRSLNSLKDDNTPEFGLSLSWIYFNWEATNPWPVSSWTFSR